MQTECKQNANSLQKQAENANKAAKRTERRCVGGFYGKLQVIPENPQSAVSGASSSVARYLAADIIGNRSGGDDAESKRQKMHKKLALGLCKMRIEKNHKSCCNDIQIRGAENPTTTAERERI